MPPSLPRAPPLLVAPSIAFQLNLARPDFQEAQTKRPFKSTLNYLFDLDFFRFSWPDGYKKKKKTRALVSAAPGSESQVAITAPTIAAGNQEVRFSNLVLKAIAKGEAEIREAIFTVKVSSPQ